MIYPDHWVGEEISINYTKIFAGNGRRFRLCK